MRRIPVWNNSRNKMTLTESLFVVKVVLTMDEKIVFARVGNMVITDNPLPQKVIAKDEFQLARYGTRIIMVKRAAHHEANPHSIHLSPPSECNDPRQGVSQSLEKLPEPSHASMRLEIL